MGATMAAATKVRRLSPNLTEEPGMSPPLFRCRLSAPTSPLPHFWEHTVGSCHAPLALRADWQAQLRRCHDELGFRRVRFHGLLCDDVGTCIRYRDRIIYSFYNADAIVAYLRSIGMQPFVELSFMPRALASGTDTIFSYRANVTPPKDFTAWAELLRRLLGHWIERFGAEEVRQWYFEVWNEPNLRVFWAGSQEQYFELYRHSVQALKGVDEGLRVGGPATAANAWIEEFLAFCMRQRLPVDFVSTHHYPNDPLWSEKQDTESELAGSRRGILREWAEQVRRQARGLPVLYTEWNISSNPRYTPQDESYAAAFVVKTVLEMNGLVDAYSFWTFTDLFEENYFPSVPFHGGFGLLNLHGIPKPTYRAFELLHRLGTEALPVTGQHTTVDAWAVRGGQKLTVLLANHALPRQPIETQQVRIELIDCPPPRSATVERIDDEHANARTAWIALGSPEYPTEKQIAALHDASQLRPEPISWQRMNDTVTLNMRLPSHAVAAVVLEFDVPV
jgi:xylan 1,4-beta-xylosidase